MKNRPLDIPFFMEKRLLSPETQNSESDSLERATKPRNTKKKKGFSKGFSKRLRFRFLTAVLVVTTVLGFGEAIDRVNSVESIAQAANQLEFQTVEEEVGEVEEIKVTAAENRFIAEKLKELYNSPTATFEEIKQFSVVLVKCKIAPAVNKADEVSLESEEDFEEMLNYKGILLTTDMENGTQVIVRPYYQPTVERSKEKHFFQDLLDAELIHLIDTTLTMKTEKEAKELLKELATVYFEYCNNPPYERLKTLHK